MIRAPTTIWSRFATRSGAYLEIRVGAIVLAIVSISATGGFANATDHVEADPPSPFVRALHQSNLEFATQLERTLANAERGLEMRQRIEARLSSSLSRYVAATAEARVGRVVTGIAHAFEIAE